jgi:hypothetical protein
VTSKYYYGKGRRSCGVFRDVGILLNDRAGVHLVLVLSRGQHTQFIEIILNRKIARVQRQDPGQESNQGPSITAAESMNVINAEFIKVQVDESFVTSRYY